MNIFDCEDLENEGVSCTQVKQSLQIECFDKVFRRSADLPKKFKTKAFNLCLELTDKGINNFITETNYSYTIWEEAKQTQQEEKNHLLKEENTEKTSSSSSLFIHSKEELNNNVPKPKEKIEAKIEPQIFIRISPSHIDCDEEDTNIEPIFTPHETLNQQQPIIGNELNETQTYRGVEISKQTKFNLSVCPKKSRTYRGVVY